MQEAVCSQSSASVTVGNYKTASGTSGNVQGGRSFERTLYQLYFVSRMQTVLLVHSSSRNSCRNCVQHWQKAVTSVCARADAEALRQEKMMYSALVRTGV